MACKQADFTTLAVATFSCESLSSCEEPIESHFESRLEKEIEAYLSDNFCLEEIVALVKPRQNITFPAQIKESARESICISDSDSCDSTFECSDSEFYRNAVVNATFESELAVLRAFALEILPWTISISWIVMQLAPIVFG